MVTGNHRISELFYLGNDLYDTWLSNHSIFKGRPKIWNQGEKVDQGAFSLIYFKIKPVNYFA